MTVLHYALSQRVDAAVIKLLLSRAVEPGGGDLELRNLLGMTPLLIVTCVAGAHQDASVSVAPGRL